MNSLKFRLVIAALAIVALAGFGYGCSDDTGNPAGPDQSGLTYTITDAVTDCGVDKYLTDLSPVLASWEDSLEAWLGPDMFDTPPAYTVDSEPVPYLQSLIPVLDQWETMINTTLDSAVVDTVPAFDPTQISVPGYLVELSDMLAQWESSLETYRGENFLATPPVFEPDTTDPVIICEADTTIGCADSSGVAVEFDVKAVDNCDPDPVVTCDPASGSTFPLGETLVTCTAVDSAGNSAECTFTVTVEAATPPVILCPADTTIECSGENGTVFEYEVIAISECDTNLTVVCVPPSGYAFPNGTTTVVCSVVDKFGNKDECGFNVTVVDTEPPVLVDAFASPGEIWPPNHKMVDVTISVEFDDVCDEAPVCTIVDVTSNEPINGKGDGNTEPDWEITGDMTVELRAERAGGGNGRIYYIHLYCEDSAGNGAEHTVEVFVPHDQGNGDNDDSQATGTHDSLSDRQG